MATQASLAHPPDTAPCGCAKRTVLRELSAEDSATLRQLRAATAATSGTRSLHPTQDSEWSHRGTMTSIARGLDRLAAEQVADPDRLAEMARWLRDHLPEPRPLGGAAEPPPAGLHPRDILAAWIRAAADHGYTLEAMAQVVGLTRERIRQIAASGRTVPAQYVPPIVGQPRTPEPLPWPLIMEQKWRAWPRPTLTAEETAELVDLQKLATKLRGQHRADDPRRIASETLAKRIADLIDTHGFTYNELADIVGVTYGAIRARLANHGYRKLPPSQPGYQGYPAST